MQINMELEMTQLHWGPSCVWSLLAVQGLHSPAAFLLVAFRRVCQGSVPSSSRRQPVQQETGLWGSIPLLSLCLTPSSADAK